MAKITYDNLGSAVKEAAVKLLPFYTSVKKAMAPDSAVVWFNNGEKNLYTDCHKTQEAFEKKGFQIGYVDSRLSDEGEWIFVKSAGTPVWKVIKPITQAMNLAPAAWNKPLGNFGTSPLFSMLTSGLLGGGLGYMGGALAEHLLPEEYIERGKLRKTTALLGALAGAAPAAYLGTVGHRNWKDPNRSAWNSWVEPNVFFGQQANAIKDASQKLLEETKGSIDESIVKAAFDYGTSSAGLATLGAIPVDAFNRTVMTDPFTPIGIRAATIGLTEAADQAKGNMGIINPFDIARIGVGMGAGLSQAYLGGKVLGALAGLTPKAQTTLQQTGMFAGALKAVVPGLFGM
jgi:hypothetical protein